MMTCWRQRRWCPLLCCQNRKQRNGWGPFHVDNSSWSTHRHRARPPRPPRLVSRKSSFLELCGQYVYAKCLAICMSRYNCAQRMYLKFCWILDLGGFKMTSRNVECLWTPSSGGGNSSLLHDSQGVDELATLDRYHHFHGHSGLCA